MVPNPPPRTPPTAFVYVPPYRIQGYSIGGEESVVQVPELDVCFDIGRCPRLALNSRFVALSHGHMDHAAGLAYYFSQRFFLGMDVGNLICHPDVGKAVHNIMSAWVQLESQRTPYKIIALEHDQEHEIKHNVMLRAFTTTHTVPSLGFVAVEMRSKLKPELVDLTQEQLIELKKKGEQITHTLEIPQVCYTGDTAMGPHFDRPDVLGAKVLIVECTFCDRGHRDRAAVGKHLHLDDIVELLERSSAETVVLTHLSRRTHIAAARDEINEVIPERHHHRVIMFMDGRTNRVRYEQQQREAEQEAPAG